MPSQIPTEKEAEVQSRYSYLLKPIRDLFKNWEIDIAADLEEYLNEMEQIKISFDGGQTVMNFAEAALLIQGSACIYSKKVEYLYTLVNQTLELISSKRKLQQASSVDDQGKDKDVSSQEQQQEEFLLLDDIKEAKNIDLKENIENSEVSRFIPRTPVTLITFDDSKKGSALLSLTGEVLGKRNDFKMNTCSVHLGSGALLLDSSNLPLVQNKAFQRGVTSTPNEEAGLDVEINQLPVNDIQEDHNDDGLQDADGFNNDTDDMNVDDVQPLTPTAVEIINEPLTHEMKLRERKQHDPFVNVQEKKFKDPWKTLDPHDPNGGVHKPFKKGRPFKIPASVREVSTKKRKRKSQDLKEETLLPIAEFCRLAYHSHAKKLPRVSHKALIHQEFEYIYWMEFRRRQMLERKTRKILSRMLPFDDEFIKLEPNVDENNNDEAGDNLDCDDREPSGFDDDDDNDQVDVGDDNMTAMEERIRPIALEESDDLVVSSYEELVRKYVKGFLIKAQQYVQETDLSRRVKDWERKVVPKLENEDSHQPYDIHKYGENVLETFSSVTPVKSFKDVVVNKEPWEICRFFLASLQLANNYNIEIGSGENKDLEMDSMQLRLLHKTPAHQAISQYRAPSVVT